MFSRKRMLYESIKNNFAWLNCQQDKLTRNLTLGDSNSEWYKLEKSCYIKRYSYCNKILFRLQNCFAHNIKQHLLSEACHLYLSIYRAHYDLRRIQLICSTEASTMRPARFYERLDIYQKYLSYNHAESVQKENRRVEKRNYFFIF